LDTTWHGQGLSEQLREAQAAVLPGLLPLAAAAVQAGAVRVSPQVAFVPAEYLREAVGDSVDALLRNLAAEVPRGRPVSSGSMLERAPACKRGGGGGGAACRVLVEHCLALHNCMKGAYYYGCISFSIPVCVQYLHSSLVLAA
jgi:hypothetical protein